MGCFGAKGHQPFTCSSADFPIYLGHVSWFHCMCFCTALKSMLQKLHKVSCCCYDTCFMWCNILCLVVCCSKCFMCLVGYPVFHVLLRPLFHQVSVGRTQTMWFIWWQIPSFPWSGWAHVHLVDVARRRVCCTVSVPLRPSPRPPVTGLTSDTRDTFENANTFLP